MGRGQQRPDQPSRAIRRRERKVAIRKRRLVQTMVAVVAAVGSLAMPLQLGSGTAGAATALSGSGPFLKTWSASWMQTQRFYTLTEATDVAKRFNTIGANKLSFKGYVS